MRRILVIGFAVGLAASAQAQEIRGPYAGLSLGLLSYSAGDDPGPPISDNTSAYRVVGGYHFNSNYAIEASWGESGDLKQTLHGFDAFGDFATLDTRVDYEIASARFLALAPFSRIMMFGGLGYYDAKQQITQRLESPSLSLRGSRRSNESGATVTGGFLFERNRIALRGEYEWFDTDGDVELSSLGVTALFRF